MILVWEITVRQTFSSDSFTRALVGIFLSDSGWIIPPTAGLQLILKGKLESDGLLFLFFLNFVCACVLYHLFLNEVAISKPMAIKPVLVGWLVLFEYAQPSPVRNLLWPNTQLAPCPCLLHFLFCNPEQGL